MACQYKVRRHSLILVLLTLPLAAVAGRIDHVSVEKVGERYHVEGEIVIAASAKAVYRLLTDYDALAELDKGISESRLVDRVDGNAALVYTKLSGCIVFFCRKVDRMERVEEVSDTELVATVIPDENGNVTYGRSQWRLFADPAGTRVLFQSEVEPNFWIPALLGPTLIKSALKRRVKRTLDSLERAALAHE